MRQRLASQLASSAAALEEDEARTLALLSRQRAARAAMAREALGPSGGAEDASDLGAAGDAARGAARGAAGVRLLAGAAEAPGTTDGHSTTEADVAGHATGAAGSAPGMPLLAEAPLAEVGAAEAPLAEVSAAGVGVAQPRAAVEGPSAVPPAQPGLDAPADTPDEQRLSGRVATCSACRRELPRAGFSASQLKKPVALQRCKGCLTAGATADLNDSRNIGDADSGVRPPSPPTMTAPAPPSGI